MIITKNILRDETDVLGEKLEIKITPETPKEKTILSLHVDKLKEEFEKTLDNLYKPVTIEEAIKNVTL
jgi:hypothetical protein